MARPSAKELTQRELEVMHVFWTVGPQTVAEIRDQLAAAGRDLAYTTVATLVRILSEKGFLEQINDERPFQYRPVRSYEEVSRSILGDLVERVFRGSREQLLLRLVEERKLSAKERTVLEAILRGRAFLPKGEAMNTIGIALVWCAVQVTLIGLLAGGLYILVRRMRPAAAAPVVLTGLVMVVILSLLALSPWPRWTIGRSMNTVQSAVASANIPSLQSDDSAQNNSPLPLGEAPQRVPGGEGCRALAGFNRKLLCTKGRGETRTSVEVRRRAGDKRKPILPHGIFLADTCRRTFPTTRSRIRKGLALAGGGGNAASCRHDLRTERGLCSASWQYAGNCFAAGRCMMAICWNWSMCFARNSVVAARSRSASATIWSRRPRSAGAGR